MGVEDWNSTFEKAGFKNAIIAKDPPSKEEIQISALKTSDTQL